MFIKNPDIFRSWLIRQLVHICKAKPESVSKYVCALLKKDKTGVDLKANLVSQLYIFLHNSTEEFVDFLLDVLANDKYLDDNVNFKLVASSNDVSKNTESKVDAAKIDVPVQLIEKKADENAEPPNRNSIQRCSSPVHLTDSNALTENSTVSVPMKRSNSRNDKSKTIRRGRRESSGSNSPPVNRRRNNSSSSSESSSDGSPRRSWNASKNTERSRYRNRITGKSSHRGASGLPPYVKFRRNRLVNSSTAKNDRMICNNESRSSQPNDLRIEFENHNKDEDDTKPLLDVAISKEIFPTETHSKIDNLTRCSDYEDKGVCARGGFCPFDHGPAPIVLSNNMLNQYVPLSQPVPRNNCLYPPMMPYPRPPFVSGTDFPANVNRDLIPVPTFPSSNVKSKFRPTYGHVFSSLPPGVSQTSLELTNVLAEKNNIPDLFACFSQFGKITLLQVQRNGDEKSALISFTNATEAAMMFTNIANVMPNVKATWYADKCILKPNPRKAIPAPVSNTANTTVLKSPSAFVLKRNTTPVSTSSMEGKEIPSNNLSVANDPIKNLASQQNSAVKQKTVVNEMSLQDTILMLTGIIKKKRSLLEKQIDSRKEIEQKIELFVAAGDEENVLTWRDILKKLNKVINENKKSFQESLEQRKVYANKLKTNLLKNSTAKLAITSAIRTVEGIAMPPNCVTLPKNTNNHFQNGINKDVYRILVSGFENGEEQELIDHFSQFGQVIDKKIDNALPSATISYNNLKSAEDAIKLGTTFQEHNLIVTSLYSNADHTLKKSPSTCATRKVIGKFEKTLAKCEVRTVIANSETLPVKPEVRTVIGNPCDPIKTSSIPLTETIKEEPQIKEEHMEEDDSL